MIKKQTLQTFKYKKIDNFKLSNFWENLITINKWFEENSSFNVFCEKLIIMFNDEEKLSEFTDDWDKLIDLILVKFVKSKLFRNIFDYTEEEKQDIINLYNDNTNRIKLFDKLKNTFILEKQKHNGQLWGEYIENKKLSIYDIKNLNDIFNSRFPKMLFRDNVGVWAKSTNPNNKKIKRVRIYYKIYFDKRKIYLNDTEFNLLRYPVEDMNKLLSEFENTLFEFGYISEISFYDDNFFSKNKSDILLENPIFNIKNIRKI